MESPGSAGHAVRGRPRAPYREACRWANPRQEMAESRDFPSQCQKSYFCHFHGLIAPHRPPSFRRTETIPLCKKLFQPASAMPPRLDTGGLRPDPWEPPKWRAVLLSHPVERGAFIFCTLPTPRPVTPGVLLAPAVARRALDAFGLLSLAELPAILLSAGQRRRLALARLLAAPAPLWLLDEPNAALDEESHGRLAVALERHRADGGIVIAAAH